MDEKTIQIGDLVNVRFERIPNILGVRVVALPCQGRESWSLYDEVCQLPYEVYSFGTIEVIKRKKEKK